MAVAALNREPGAGPRFFLEFTGADGTRHRESLTACVTGRFENALPVRSFQWTKGASHFPGSWWSSTTGDHVGFESWLERDHVMAMDFDPGITGIASQPFWLHWQDEDGRPRRHWIHNSPITGFKTHLQNQRGPGRCGWCPGSLGRSRRRTPRRG